jgi:hypothetical protein
MHLHELSSAINSLVVTDRSTAHPAARVQALLQTRSPQIRAGCYALQDIQPSTAKS